jgi:hypothetical protein
MVVAASTSVAARARVEVGTAALLGGLLALSFAVRLIAGWPRATPDYFSDEYLYAELGRSFLCRATPPVATGERA